MRQSLKDHFAESELELATVSQESLLGEMLQQVTNIFHYRPFNDTKMAKAAIDPVRERIKSMYRLERLLRMCYTDPRWLSQQTVQTDLIGGMGIVNLLSFGEEFSQDDPLRHIEHSVYNINNFRVNWAKSTVRHSDYARKLAQDLITELSGYCKPMIAAAQRANERAAKQVQDRFEKEKRSNEFHNNIQTKGTQGRQDNQQILKVEVEKVDEWEIIKNAARTSVWEDIVAKHLRQMETDSNLRRLSPDRFWASTPETIALYGGQTFNSRRFQITKNPAPLTQIRPLTIDEIKGFGEFIVKVIRNKTFTVWADTVANEAPEGVFISMANGNYPRAIANGRHGNEISQFIGAKPNMLGWKRGIAIENQIEPLVVGMIRWMSRSLIGGSRM